MFGQTISFDSKKTETARQDQRGKSFIDLIICGLVHNVPVMSPLGRQIGRAFIRR